MMLGRVHRCLTFDRETASGVLDVQSYALALETH